MATTNKGLNLPSAGSTGWNVPLNANTDILDKAFGSFTTISSTSGVTDLTSDQVQNMCIKSTTSAFLANVTYRIPSGVAGQWVIQNQSATSAYTLTVSNVAGGTSVTVGIGTVRSIYSDGTNVVYADTPSTGDFVNASVSGTLTLGGGDLTGVATQVEAEDGTDNVKVMTPLRVSQAITALTSIVDFQTFSASGTWTKPAGASANAMVFIEMWGGGGSGGRGAGNGQSAGGGGGAYTSWTLKLSSLDATEAVVVGTGGASKTTTGPGNAGTNSTFNGVTAYAGGGGSQNTTSGAVNGYGGGQLSSGAAGVGLLGGGWYDYSGGGSVNVYPDLWGGGAGYSTTGAGGASVFGGAGGGGAGYAGGVSKFGGSGGAGTGVDGSVPGGGGGGRANGNSGAGGNGLVNIWVIG